MDRRHFLSAAVAGSIFRANSVALAQKAAKSFREIGRMWSRATKTSGSTSARRSRWIATMINLNNGGVSPAPES